MFFRSIRRYATFAWNTGTPREGDWLCQCRRLNFQKHKFCCSCERPVPPAPVVYGRWKCTVCTSNNGSSREKCWDCDAKRPGNWKEIIVERRREWTCSFFECRNRNPASAHKCQRCKRSN